MKDTEKLGVDLTLTRRQMLGSVGAAAGAATVLSMAPWADVQAEVDKLKEEGWEAHPCACNVCGGYCGLLALHKKGAPVSRETFALCLILLIHNVVAVLVALAPCGHGTTRCVCANRSSAWVNVGKASLKKFRGIKH